MSWLRDLVGDDPRYRRHLTYALVAGLILRVVLVALVWEDPPTGASIGYHRLAYNVAHHGVFALEKVPSFTPTVVPAALCSLVVAAPMAIFGDHLPRRSRCSRWRTWQARWRSRLPSGGGFRSFRSPRSMRCCWCRSARCSRPENI